MKKIFFPQMEKLDCMIFQFFFVSDNDRDFVL